MDDIWHLLFYFLIYAFIGWLWETVYCSIKERKFVYRGFLFGPYCPIYGFGVLLLLVVLSPLKENVVALFVAAIVVMSLLEYVVSYVLEKVFHQRWWDYAGRWGNINGRIAVIPSLFWGVMSVVVIYYLHPWVIGLADTVIGISKWIPLVAVLLVVIDAIYTITRMVGFSKFLDQLRSVVNDTPGQLSDRIDKRVKQLRTSGRLRFTERRLMKAFPRAVDVRIERYAKIRDELLAMAKDKGRAKKQTKKK